MRYLRYIETSLVSAFVLASPTQMFGRGDCPKLFNYNQLQKPAGRHHSLGARSGGYVSARHTHTKVEPNPSQRANYGNAAFRK